MLTERTCRAAAPLATASKGMRTVSHTTPLFCAKAVTISRSWGATPCNTVNRLSRPPSRDKGMSRLADIGLIISMSPSSVVCTRPIGARYRNCISDS
jgi:hypothetical protein